MSYSLPYLTLLGPGYAAVEEGGSSGTIVVVVLVKKMEIDTLAWNMLRKAMGWDAQGY